MVEIWQGEIWWAELEEPTGSAPGFRRPVVIVQGNALNRSLVETTVCVPLTSNLKWADAPGNVLIPGRLSGLPRDSVANVSQIIAIDRCILAKRVGRVPGETVQRILNGIDIVLGR